MSKHPDVVVIGGGIIGLTCAYFLAKAGVTVEVLERGEPGREASWAGAGIIPPGNPDRAATPIDRLRAIGSARFPSFSAYLHGRTGIDNGYLRCGGVEFLQPGDEDVLPLWEAEGIAFERLTPDGLNRLEPAAGAVSGEPYLLPDCAQVRNPWHLRALVAACDVVGMTIRPQQAVQHFVTDGTRVVAVRLEDGRDVRAGSFLIAAGAWSEALLAQLGHRPNVHPVRGQIALFRPPRRLLTRVLMVGKEYLVPRADGRVLAGSTEEPEAGFVKANTPAAVEKLTAFATRTVPALADAPVEKCWAGLRPGSPDGLPFLGVVPGYRNAYVAAGHFRAGVQLSVGTALVMSELLTGRPPSAPLAAFALDRTPSATSKPAFRS
jgi:glycine oxidase